MKTTFIKCSCSSEALCLEKDEEEDLLYVSIWERGYGKDNRYSWGKRLKHCWQVLTKGRPYGDQIVLDKTGRSELVYTLVENYITKKIYKNSKEGNASNP